jgi:hypothetical protein
MNINGRTCMIEAESSKEVAKKKRSLNAGTTKIKYYMDGSIPLVLPIASI